MICVDIGAGVNVHGFSVHAPENCVNCAQWPLAPVSVYLTVVAALQTMPGQYLPQLATATIGPGPAATMPGAPP